MRGLDLQDLKLNSSIIEQQYVVWTAIGNQRFVVNSDSLLVPRSLVQGSVENELLPLFEDHFSFRKTRNSNFRTLQIRQYRHEATVLGSQLTDQSGTSNVVLSLAVGKIQTHDIDARFHQSLDGFE
ncbi:hypothetical protein D3C86_1178400 [compost metagenome]